MDRVCNFIGYWQDAETVTPEILKDCIVIRPDDYWLEVVKDFASKKMKRLLMVTCKFGKYYKRRSTGDRSQNHRINGFIQQIIVGYGLDFSVEEMKWYFKKLAVGRGYPFKTMPDGEIIPKSESKCTTVEAMILSQTIEEWAGKQGFRLKQYNENGEVVYV
jgi:hypothetical protein